jgi:SAM-dependent methyltransferase
VDGADYVVGKTKQVREKMMINRWLLQPDVYLRHWIIAEKLRETQARQDKKPLRVLDVGGGSLNISDFSVDVDVTTANVVPEADIIYNGKKLPLKSNSFDVVISVDTLEHVPPKSRVGFVDDLMRVSKSRLILIAPYASRDHVILERRLEADLKKAGNPVPDYLKEHIKYGLVNENQLGQIKKLSKKVEIVRLSNTLIDRINFSVHNFEVRNGKLNKLIYYLKFAWNFIENLISPLFYKRSSKVTASRVLVVIDKIGKS